VLAGSRTALISLTHAARDLLRSVATRLEILVDEAARRAGIPVLHGRSIKAALDIDWDDATAKRGALEQLLVQVQALETFVATELAAEANPPPISDQLATLHQLISQDAEPDPDGGPRRMKQGVAKERRISVVDGDMRARPQEQVVTRGRLQASCRARPQQQSDRRRGDHSAVSPQAEASEDLLADISRQNRQINELQIDRGHLADPEVATLRAG
jgi:hypothetical protein